MNYYYEKMMSDIEDLMELNNIRLVSGERKEDPGVRYFFYCDLSTGRPVSPYFHNSQNAENWFIENMG